MDRPAQLSASDGLNTRQYTRKLDYRHDFRLIVRQARLGWDAADKYDTCSESGQFERCDLDVHLKVCDDYRYWLDSILAYFSVDQLVSREPNIDAIPDPGSQRTKYQQWVVTHSQAMIADPTSLPECVNRAWYDIAKLNERWEELWSRRTA